MMRNIFYSYYTEALVFTKIAQIIYLDQIFYW
jgi:hypothetical protein